MVSGAPTVSVYLEGRTRQFIIDTGSSMCLIQPGTSQAEVNKTNISLVGITGDELPLKGEQFNELTLGGKVFRHRFGVCVLPTKADGILGTDFVSTHRARLDLTNLKLEVGNSPQTDHCGVSNGGRSFTIFPARIRQASRNASLPQERECTPKEESCQRRSGKHEFKAALGDVAVPSYAFQVAHCDIVGPFHLTEGTVTFSRSWIN
jgi:hypothetical protein